MRGFPAVEAAGRSLRREGEGGQIGESGGEQGGFGLFHTEVGRTQVGVAHEGSVDQRAEARIGEDLLPGEAAEVGGGVGRIRAFLAVKAVGNLGSGFVFGVNAATAECQRGGKGYD